MLKLYHFPFAPNPLRVITYLKEKQIPDIECVLVDLFTGEQNSEEHLARTPRGVVPVLELEDGRYLSETVPIIEYIEELYPEPVMIGRTPDERAFTRAAERDIELNLLARTIRLVHATKSPLGLPPNPAIADAENARLPAALERIDALVGDNPFALGDAPTIADCTLLPVFNFCRLAELELEAPYPNLKRWYHDFTKRQESLPEVL